MNVQLHRAVLRPIHNLPRAVARRWPALAVATVVAAVPVVAFASSNLSGSGNPGVEGGGVNDGVGVLGHSVNNLGVWADSSYGTGLKARSEYATGVEAIGLVALSAHSNVPLDNPNGIQPHSSGVVVDRVETGVNASGTKTGVRGFSTSGTAVEAATTNGTAVDASSSKTAVQARSYSGTAISASSGGSNTQAVVAYADQPGTTGVNAFGATNGVYAEGGTALFGRSYTGYGAELAGAQAPLRLDPAATAGAPTSGTHHKGELYVDTNGQLFLCVTDSTGGNPGTWKKVVLQ